MQWALHKSENTKPCSILAHTICNQDPPGITWAKPKRNFAPMPKQNSLIFSLDHAFSNYDERKTNEMHFQSKPYI
jgi:hypothetical protein